MVFFVNCNKNVTLFVSNKNVTYICGMKSSSLIKLIETDGWYLVRTKGSHHHYKHKIKKGIVTIPHPKKDMPIATVKSILRQAGL